MKKDKFFKKDNRVYGRYKGTVKTLQLWQIDPICPLTDRQLRRRVREYMLGVSHLSVEQILTTRCIPRKQAEPRDRAAEKERATKQLTEAQLWERKRNRHAISPIWSPRVADGILRHRMIARMVVSDE